MELVVSSLADYEYNGVERLDITRDIDNEMKVVSEVARGVLQKSARTDEPKEVPTTITVEAP